MERIGRYEIIGELGRGGMAVVYHARDLRIERDVALKIMAAGLLEDDTVRMRFVREVHSVASLEHRAVVPVYDYGEEDGRPYLVMRLMPGGSLKDRLAQGALPLPEILRVLDRIGDALDKAHSRGIIHRDLKPANILYDDDGRPYLSDFGIAKDVIDRTLTLTGEIVGTPAYMSPEQVRGETLIDGRSDIYVLGIVLFEMLTGRLPYDADTPMSVAMAHVTKPVPQLREAAPHIPETYQAVIERAMAKDRDQRYQRASDLAAAVKQLASSAPFSAPPPQRRQKVLDAAIKSTVTVGVTARLLVLVRDVDGQGLHALLEIEPDYGLSPRDVRVSRGFDLYFPRDESGALLPAQIEIVVIAPDFKPDRMIRWVQINPVQEEDYLEPVEFRLTPLVPGKLSLTIEVYQEFRDERHMVGSKPLLTECRQNESPLANYRVMSMYFGVLSIDQFIAGQQVNIGQVEGDIDHIGDVVSGQQVNIDQVGGDIGHKEFVDSGQQVSIGPIEGEIAHIGPIGDHINYVDDVTVGVDRPQQDDDPLTSTGSFAVPPTVVDTPPVTSTTQSIPPPLPPPAQPPASAGARSLRRLAPGLAVLLVLVVLAGIFPIIYLKNLSGSGQSLSTKVNPTLAAMAATVTSQAQKMEMTRIAETAIAAATQTAEAAARETFAVQASETAVAATATTFSITATADRAIALDLTVTSAAQATEASTSPETAGVLGPERIAFQSNRDGDYDIYITDIEGRDLRQLTGNNQDDQYPRVSPDGRFIAFQSARDGNSEIYVMDIDGANQTRLTFDPGDDRLPSWSPDGQHIIFASNRVDPSSPAVSDIYVIDRDGGNLRQMTSEPAYESHPSWSVDGRIAFNVTDRGTNYWQIYTANSDGSDRRRITFSQVDEWSPEWSPDGRLLLFHSERDDSANAGIYVMDIASREVQLLYNSSQEEWGASWSADGSHIIFAIDQPDGTSDLYIMDAAGRNPRLLLERGGYPSWVPP